MVEQPEDSNKKIEPESSGFISTQPEPEGVCWKSENNVNQFEVSRDDDAVIKWHT